MSGGAVARVPVRVVVTWLIVSLGLVGVARAVALPEACDVTTSTQRRSSVESAIAWIVDNQSANGRFLYRYDAVDDVVEPGYNWVRHAGTMLALEQARLAGFDGVDSAIDSARRAIDAELVRVDAGEPRIGVRDGSIVSTGGTALLLLAVTEPMIGGTMDADEVAFARGLARHVAGSVWTSNDGVTRVREVADDSLNFSDVVGRFTTGEVAFALARMERLFPGEGWGDRIPDIVDYLVRRKAVEEGFVPDMADHWAAYAFAETTTWSEPLAFDDIARSWARKQMGISSVMIRYEGQLTNGFPDRALRGATALGAAVGTHGEAMAGWTTYFAANRGVDDDMVAAGVARLACNIGTLTARQIDSDEAASYAQPRRVEGAWLSGGVTQVDDQQHAMSAVLAGDRVSGGSIDPRPSRRQPLDWSWVLVLAAAVAVAAPSRVATVLVRSPRSMRRDAVVAGVTALVLALFSVPILEAVDVSVPTAAVASGVVVVLASLATFVGMWRHERSFMVVARPELLLLVLAGGAGSRSLPLIAGLVFAYGLAEWLTRFDDDVRVWATRLESLVAIAVGVALVVNGVYSI